MTRRKVKAKKKDIMIMVESIANERGIEEDLVYDAVEAALAAVAAKTYPEVVGTRVTIDRKTGDQETFRYWDVVADDEEIEFPELQMPLSQAKEIDENLEVGDRIEDQIENVDMARIAATQAKQVLLSKVREAERNKIVAEFEGRVGEMVTGTVKRTSRDSLIIDLGNNAEGLMPREEMIPRENFRMNDRIRAYIKSTREEQRGPQVVLSRACPEFLVELFRIEVPEIGEDVIQILAAARDPGSRAKIAVKTNDGRIDPIGACVGMRGSRVQAVSNELNGERIDIILWDENPAQLAINAMAPAEVQSIVADELTHSMDIAVDEEQLSQAIGRSGQNVRLASELIGWKINIMSESDAAEKQQSEATNIKDTFIKDLDVDEAVAGVLIEAGFTTLDEIAYIDPEEFLQVGVFDEATIAELQSRASDVLLTRELATEMDDDSASDDIANVAGMTSELAELLAQHEIKTREDLADLATDELVELGVENELASQLIMEARKPWFEEE